MSASRIPRRTFLTRTAAGVGAAGLTSCAAQTVAPKRSPGSRLNIAGIGFGSMGGSNLRQLAGENIVALCDVDHEYAGKVFAAFPDAKRYTDYRVMIEKQKDIDAVVIATPDHTHAVISMAAMRAGKHVYCQKPLTHDVFEARRLAEAAREYGVVTQMGIQGHSGDGARQVCEWIWSGAIGDVREVDAWCDLTYYPWGHASWSSMLGTRPTETPPVPDSLDWDLWLGPAPVRPYHRCYHPRTWRSWLDFGCGMMGDRGVHTLDPVFWALKLGQPTSVDASSTDLNNETHPIASVVKYEFPAREGMPPVALTWYDGVRPPRPEDVGHDENLGHPEGGVVFKGSKGMMTCGVYGENPRLVPASRMNDFTPPDPSIPRVEGTHEGDWVRAIKDGGKAGADFSYSGPLTEMALLGNVAKRMNTKIEWDAENLKVTNLPEANQYVRTAYREGWSL
ncbi:MAG: Gfo/Idh/MocA family oxidoreductase [bacterium]|nr:Gfo/Idh/MocA family oxidoreductase [bacterium]